MTRRARSRLLLAAAWIFGLGIIVWDAAHGRWQTGAWFLGTLLIVLILVVAGDWWIDRGKP